MDYLIKIVLLYLFLDLCSGLPAFLRKNTRKRNCRNRDEYAVCHMVPNPGTGSRVNGTIYFHQPVTSDCNYDFLNIQVDIEHVPTKEGTRMHGLHVHETGDMTRGCTSMGGHFNPRRARHGSPWDHPGARHVGDFGNVKQRKSSGRIRTRLVDYLASLTGPESIIGRGMVLHEGKDDLGRNPDMPGSRWTGNAGARLACCVIEPSQKPELNQFSLYR